MDSGLIARLWSSRRAARSGECPIARPLRIRSSNWLRRSIRVRRRLCLRRCARRSAGHWLIRPVRRPVASDLTANRAAVASKPPADLGLRDTAAKQPVDLVALPFLELFIMLSPSQRILKASHLVFESTADFLEKIMR